MKRCLNFMVAFVVLATLFLSIPMNANAQSDNTAFSQAAAVARLRDGMARRESPVTVQVYSDTDTSFAATLFYDAVAHDGVPTHGDYLQFHCKKISPTTDVESYGNGYLHTITYQITYRTTRTQETAVDTRVEEILAELDVYDATDYEKVAAIYNYLCANVQLDMIGNLVGATDIYTAYGALVNESAVCQGFASAFYRLALELGVDNRLISGKVGTVLHGWNIVKLDGVYYNVDATKDAGFSFNHFKYFLKSDLPTHTRDASYDSAAFHSQYPMAKSDYLHTTHCWDGGKMTQTANGYREGEKIFVCKVCGSARVEKLPKQGWALVDHEWYYYKDGKLKTGWLNSGAVRYYLDEKGIMQTGWRKIDGIWYLFDSNGAMQTGWKKLGSVWYYMNAEGKMQTGWQKPGGVWYYLSPDGAMVTGWQKLGGVWYYMNSSGAMQTGWRKIGNIWYYFDGSGAMKTGWQKLGGVWYYFHTSGAMATGTVRIGAITYKFNSSGAWIS